MHSAFVYASLKSSVKMALMLSNEFWQILFMLILD